MAALRMTNFIGMTSFILSMKDIRKITRRLMSADGAEIAEAALVLPLVFTLLLGIVWFGRAFNIYSTITQAAQQGAIFSARATCVTCANGNDYPTNTEVRNLVERVMQASKLDPAQIEASTRPSFRYCQPPLAPAAGNCTAVANIWVCRNVQLNPPPGGLAQPLQCGSVVSFEYPFQFYLPFTSLNLQKVVMSAQAQSRMED